MAKPKRFNSAKDFELQLIDAIEVIIDNKNSSLDGENMSLQVSDIALKLEVTSNTLRRWCQFYLGVSARQFVANYRLHKAQELLKAGYRPAQVASGLAFSEHKIFSTQFKKHCGFSPSHYVKRSKSG